MKPFYLIALLTSSVISMEQHQHPFKNYFGKESHSFVTQSFQRILGSLQVPHVDNNQIVSDGFFQKIHSLVQNMAPNSKVYISGGVVRSILGYLNKKLYNADQKHQQSDVMQYVQDHLLFDRKGQSKNLNPLRVLGIGSDLDILIDFDQSIDETKKQAIIDAVTKFMNSAEEHLGLRDNHAQLKKILVPVADVKEYNEQINRTTEQGGSSLDWLAYSLRENQFRHPEKHPDILENFFKGELNYIKGENPKDKQTIRGLRALLEIPFLKLTPEGQKTLLEELSKIKDLSKDAKKQIQKMVRNARLWGGDNRLRGSSKWKPIDGEISELLSQILSQHNAQTPDKKDHVHIPEFLPKHFIEQRKEDSKLLNILMPFDEFQKSLQDGFIHHGTKDLVNVVNMFRNGFVNSTGRDNTTAAYGSGFYTTNNKSTAESYGVGGAVLSFAVKKDAKILALHKSEAQAFMEQNKEFQQSVKSGTLLQDYNIDIVIPADKPDYLLIQNADVLIPQEKFRNLFQSILSLQEYGITMEDVSKYKLLDYILQKENINKIAGIIKLQKNDINISSCEIPQILSTEGIEDKEKIDNIIELDKGGIMIFADNLLALLSAKGIKDKKKIENIIALAKCGIMIFADEIAHILSTEGIEDKKKIENIIELKECGIDIDIDDFERILALNSLDMRNFMILKKLNREQGTSDIITTLSKLTKEQKVGILGMPHYYKQLRSY